MPVKKNVLFISYDGMTDPLGQSQVLPYLFGISDTGGYDITVLSCEKKDRFNKNKGLIEEICSQHKVDWQYIFFHTQPPILAKYYDFFALKRKAVELYNIKKFDIIHCRSYLSIEIGLYLKKKFGCQVIFDMRGFWVDERVDGGLWNMKNPFYRFAYSWYKKKENDFINQSDHIISLTKAAENEMKKWLGYNASVPVTIVPCSADLEVFTLTSNDQKEAARKRLDYKPEDVVISYLGSLGTWYMLDEMLDFFKQILTQYAHAKFLFLTADAPEIVFAKARERQIPEDKIQLLFAERKEVASLIKASDISLFFIKPAYSKIASSPTKLGELLVMGIPVVCNAGVGDIEDIIAFSEGGIVLEELSEAAYQNAISGLDDLMKKEPAAIRQNVKDYYNLDNAIKAYVKVYASLHP